MNLLFIEIDKDVFHRNINRIIGVIYRASNTDLKLFNDGITDVRS